MSETCRGHLWEKIIVKLFASSWYIFLTYIYDERSHLYQIYNKFDRKDSSSIKSVQELFSVTMPRNLAYIKANFCGISKSITRLETVGVQLCDATHIVKQTESELSRVQGEVANKVNAKLQSVLERNPGYSTLCNVSEILWWKWSRIGRKWTRTFCQQFDSFQVLTRYVVRCREEFFPGISFYLVTIGGPYSLAILKCMSSSTAALPETEAKLRCEFFIIVKSKYISPFVTQKVNSVYL